jgi:hypothetical protein
VEYSEAGLQPGDGDAENLLHGSLFLVIRSSSV